jgi:hypothetical protein
MDWSDEQLWYFSPWCFFAATTIDCDEHLCQEKLWSCGDGQCMLWSDRLIFQNFVPLIFPCYNMRHVNYMCELHLSGRGWTLPNGLCSFFEDHFDDLQLSLNDVTLSKDEKCVYLIRCALSDGYELDCPCNRLNCSNIMSSVCEKNDSYRYPPGPLIRPHVFTYYNWTHGFKNKIPQFFLIGGIRCRGYYGSFDQLQAFPMPLTDHLVHLPDWDVYFCSMYGIIRNKSSPLKYDNDCWKNSRTFNNHSYAFHDVCNLLLQCISQYRINDGIPDCVEHDDEGYFIENKDLCSRVRKHRFQCSLEQPTCLTIMRVGNAISHCSNQYDQYLYGHEPAISKFFCGKDNLANCQFLKEYIKNSTLIFNTNTHSTEYQHLKRIPFRSYCNSFWDRAGHIDELPQYCKYWICHQDQYQCQTGQCISLDWVFDKQWDCSDASDEEAMLAINQWSVHNEKHKDLSEKRQSCSQYYPKLPFSEFCKKEKEFPCLRSNVSNPLDVKLNRPCILYEQIGDEIEDCYNSYDEMNTFETSTNDMWGYGVRCGNKTVHYADACEIRGEQCGYIYCPNKLSQSCSGRRDAVCIDDHRCVPDGRCDGERDCLHGEDEYWCPPVYNSHDQTKYRYTKVIIIDQKNRPIFDNQTYPPKQLKTETSSILPQSFRINKDLEYSDVIYSFWCNKGVSIIMFNQTMCLCPPAYFGDKCQFFSDRISILTHLDLTTWPSNSILSKIMPTMFKIKVYFLFNEILIDHYEFNSNPAIEMRNVTKHKFYLLYSRSTKMLLHKKRRFLNRTDIEENHPYSVHFDIYGLYNNQSIPVPLGSWHYPIYFDFLPSFRLATVLRFPNSTFDPCINHTCNQNSTCRPIFNKNNSYYCACNSSFYGENCSKYEDTCNTYCSPHSFCQPEDRSLLSSTICICPLENFGPGCFLRFTQCNNNPCLNNGNCFYTYESYNGDAFICICPKHFYGDRCQHAKMPIQVILDTNNLTELSARVCTIQFYDVVSNTLELVLRHQQLFEGFPSLISYNHDDFVAPVLSVLKAHYDSIEPRYFIIYIQPNSSLTNISSSPMDCPFASSLLNKSKYFRYNIISFSSI